ncbi:MAG: hypothetical protein R2812_03710 [Gelidibacter sp.]
MASNAIATNNYTNTVPFTQTLWVRVDDNGNGCYKLTTFRFNSKRPTSIGTAHPIRIM